jgi:hypothetical protein
MRVGRLFVAIGLLFLAGCFYPRFMPPVVFQQDQHAIGAGVTAGIGLGSEVTGLAGVQGDFFYRTGVGDRADGGLRAVYSATPPRGAEHPATRSITAVLDGRYQAYEVPLTAAGLAISYTHPLTSSADAVATLTGGATVGSEHLYGGVGLVLRSVIDPEAGLSLDGPAPYLTAGAALGRRLKLLPQIGVYIDGRNLLLSRLALHVGLGLQYVVGPIDDPEFGGYN